MANIHYMRICVCLLCQFHLLVFIKIQCENKYSTYKPNQFSCGFLRSRLVTFLFVDIGEFSVFRPVVGCYFCLFVRLLLWTFQYSRCRRALDISNQSFHVSKLPCELSNGSFLYICKCIFEVLLMIMVYFLQRVVHCKSSK